MLHSQSPWDLSVYDKATPSVQPDIASASRAAAVLFEEQIRFEQVEHGAFFANDGSEILTRVGIQAQVGFTTAELQLVKGALFTHNHPAGTSFSKIDVQNACEWSLTELRVVCDEWRYMLIFRSGWPSRPAVAAEFQRVEPLICAEVASDVRSGHLHQAYFKWEVQHRIIHHIAGYFHFLYERQRS